MSHNFREELADLEHKQWQHWTEYFLTNAMDKGNIERWQKQCVIDYKDLSEKEKDSDRKWVDKVIKTLIKFLRNRKEQLEVQYNRFTDEGDKLGCERVDARCSEIDFLIGKLSRGQR